MLRLRYSTLIEAPAERVFAFHKQPDALERLLPAWPPARVAARRGGLGPGSEVEIELRLGPLRQRWVARHTGYRENQFFSGEQVRGPFRPCGTAMASSGRQAAAAGWWTRSNSRCRWRPFGTGWRAGL